MTRQAALALLAALAVYPLLWLLSQFIRNDKVTTGYVVNARK